MGNATPMPATEMAPQTVNGQNWNAHFHQDIGSRDKLVFHYGYMGDKVIAFQLVAGQNPDTTGFSNDGRVTWHRD